LPSTKGKAAKEIFMNIINNLYRIDTPLTRATDGAGKPAASGSGNGGPAIQLSALSAQLHQLETRLTSEPGFDDARVGEIKSAIRDGSFKVNAEAVADKVIQSIRELSGHKASLSNA
jgi:negative regulator of flagellin synthesis FlgM